MGTETYFLFIVTQFTCIHVKLNNPLMGTETFSKFLLLFHLRLNVKLNNPLMGTETSFFFKEVS